MKRLAILACALPAVATLCIAAVADQSTQESSRADSPVAKGWDFLAILRHREALEHFAGITGNSEARFGEAIALLSLPQRSQANLDRATVILRSLADENPTSDLAVSARYHLARIDHVHAFVPDPSAAARQYEALLSDFPGNPIAEQAAPKLAIAWLYADESPAVWESRLETLEHLERSLVSPSARRDLQLILADALLRLRADHDRALKHLWPALRGGQISRISRAKELWLQAAESSVFLGRTQDAATAYRRFLELAPRDVRVSEVRRRLSKIEGGEP